MDLWLSALIICLGIIAGIISGLIPGIHINMISTFLLVNAGILLSFTNVETLILFIISMSVTHTFLDFIPSIIFGVPDADTALSVLPAHKMVHEGRAYEAIFLSAIGSLSGMIGAVLVSILFMFVLKNVYVSLSALIPYILIVVLVTLIWQENGNNNKFWAVIIILFSGGYGLLILNGTVINEPLLVIFTGLFGLSTLIISLKESESKFAKQEFTRKTRIFNLNFLKNVFLGTTCASVCSILPGIGNAQAGTLAASIVKKMEKEGFIVVLSVINTVNFAVSIITFYLIGKSRNGSISVISQLVNEISFNSLLFYFVVMFVVSIMVFFLTLLIGRKVIKLVEKINVKKLNIVILFFLILLITYICGIIGLIATLGAMCLGILCISLGVKRVHLMSVLIVPVIINLI